MNKEQRVVSVSLLQRSGRRPTSFEKRKIIVPHSLHHQFQDMKMENKCIAVAVFQCSACKTFFQDYGRATLHLALNHLTECKNALSLSPEEEARKLRSRNSEDDVKVKGSLLETIEFPLPFIPLERVKPPKIKKPTKVKPKPPSPATTSPVPVPVVEIKLDTMKASEIEALMNDLFNNPQQYSSSSSSQSHVPRASSSRPTTNTRSGRRTSLQHYDELDSDEEVGKKKKARLSVKKRVSSTPKPKVEDAYVEYEPTASDEDPEEIELQEMDNEDDDYEEKTTTTKKTGVNKFWCRLCSTDFAGQFQYSEHMRENHLTTTEDGKEHFLCPTCNVGFFPLRVFNIHCVKVHKMRRRYPPKENPYHCEECKLSFRNLIQFDKHKSSHRKKNFPQGEKTVECPICHIRLSHRHALQRHMTRHLINNPFVCKFEGCEKSFNGEFNLRRHVLLHTSGGREIYRCPQCPASYTRANKLRDHLELHKSAKSTLRIRKNARYKIKTTKDNEEDTKKLFKPAQQPPITTANEDEDGSGVRVELESVHFSDHVVTSGKTEVKAERHSPTPWEDDQGGVDSEPETQAETDELIQRKKEIEATFLSDPVVQKLMKENPEMVHSLFLPSVTQKHTNYKCNKCGWVGTRVNYLRDHMQKWHKEKLPPINEHTTTTAGADPSSELKFMCGACGFVTKTPDELSKHLTQAHVKGKTFHCSMCGYRFATLNEKTAHEKRVHFSEKKFPCAKCPAKLSSQSNLVKHMKEKHDPEFQKERLSCKKCDKVYSTLAALHYHVRKVHSTQKKTFSCQTCGQKCATTAVLRRHIQYVHLGVVNPYNKKKQELKRRKKNAALNISSSSPTKKPLESTSPDAETENNMCSEILGF